MTSASFLNDRLDDYLIFLSNMVKGYEDNNSSYEALEEYIDYMHVVVREFNKRYKEFKDEVIEELVAWKMREEKEEKEDATEDN